VAAKPEPANPVSPSANAMVVKKWRMKDLDGIKETGRHQRDRAAKDGRRLRRSQSRPIDVG
jgi:hypothetical protein